MKKLMIAASAALCAAVGFAVESSNVVGYQTQGTASTGFAMKAASFETVGAADGSATLADIKITGYEPYDEETDEGGTTGDFYIQFLNGSGKTVAKYLWIDDDTQTGWSDGTKLVDETNVALPAGGAVWVMGAGLSMTSSGAVSDADTVVNTASVGFQALGNTTPVDVTLNDLVVSGYEPYDEETDEGGTTGDFYIQFLNANGKTTAKYLWIDDDIQTGWSDGTKLVDATNVTIPAGVGVWIMGAGFSVRIPAAIAAE